MTFSRLSICPQIQMMKAGRDRGPVSRCVMGWEIVRTLERERGFWNLRRGRLGESLCWWQGRVWARKRVGGGGVKISTFTFRGHLWKGKEKTEHDKSTKRGKKASQLQWSSSSARAEASKHSECALTEDQGQSHVTRRWGYEPAVTHSQRGFSHCSMHNQTNKQTKKPTDIHSQRACKRWIKHDE